VKIGRLQSKMENLKKIDTKMFYVLGLKNEV